MQINRTGQRGETLRCIIGKAISITLKYDIQVTVGPLQLCAGFKGGCEAAVHSMQQLFSLPQFDAVIQVDACNAFNFLNRQTALTDRGTRFFPTQRSVLRCSVSSLWMATGSPPLLPSQCVCDKTFSVEHALSCPHSGFSTIRHNEIRDITVHLLSDICHNVGIEPPLQHITSETMSYRTANVEEGARLNIKAQGFW